MSDEPVSEFTTRFANGAHRTSAVRLEREEALLWVDGLWRSYPGVDAAWKSDDDQLRYIQLIGPLSFRIDDGPIIDPSDRLGLVLRLSRHPSLAPGSPGKPSLRLESYTQPDGDCVYARFDGGHWHCGGQPGRTLIVARRPFFTPPPFRPRDRSRLSPLAARPQA